MFKFGKKKEEEADEEELIVPQKPVRKVERKPKKEVPVVWGKKERMFVGVILFTTVFLSVVFAISTTGLQIKVPTFEKINIELPKVETSGKIVLTKEESDVVDYKKIENEMLAKVEGLKSNYGVWVIDLDNNQSFGFNEKEQIEGASLFKMPLMIAVFTEIDKGNLSLDDTLQGTTYENLLSRMGKHSDNNAFLAVLKKIGSKKVNETIKNIGMKDTSFSESVTTPFDMALLFQKLVKGELISETSRDKLLSYITNTDYEEYIAAGVPEDVVVSHKYGREVGVLNDVGVVEARRPFIISFMTSSVNEFEVTTTIPQLTEIVYNSLNDK